ncbi:hypothetical protein D3C87_1870280 [compost metagenome]
MVDGGAHHARHSRDRFQHDSAMSVSLGEEGIRTEAEQLGEAEGDAVRQPFGLMVDGEIDEWGAHGLGP